MVHLRDDKRLLRTKLGDWKPVQKYHHKWRWNYTPDGLVQRTQNNNNIQQHLLQDTVRRHFLFQEEGAVLQTMPTEYFPVEPTRNQHQYTVSFHQIFPYPRDLLPNYPERIADMICQLPSSLRSLVEHVEQLATDEEITQCLEANQIIRIASDQGAIPGRASYGWIIQIGSTEITKGKGPTHGDDPRSFRAEGYGMASSLLYLRLLERQFNFQRKRRTTNIIICDNQGLLTRKEEAVKWTYTTPKVTL